LTLTIEGVGAIVARADSFSIMLSSLLQAVKLVSAVITIANAATFIMFFFIIVLFLYDTHFMLQNYVDQCLIPNIPAPFS
jgi:hypothetical protein